jgi:hypothetical protein
LELEILFAPFTDEELRDIDKLAWDPVLWGIICFIPPTYILKSPEIGAIRVNAVFPLLYWGYLVYIIGPLAFPVCPFSVKYSDTSCVTVYL